MDRVGREETEGWKQGVNELQGPMNAECLMAGGGRRGRGRSLGALLPAQGLASCWEKD